jgi:hypothetical protein
MTYTCAFCNKSQYREKWFGLPGHIYRPNQYSVCEDHQDLFLTYEDVYKFDDDAPITKHADKVIK